MSAGTTTDPVVEAVALAWLDAIGWRTADGLVLRQDEGIPNAHSQNAFPDGEFAAGSVIRKFRMPASNGAIDIQRTAESMDRDTVA